MRKAKKTLTMVLAFVLVAALSVAGTVAYLTSTTGPVTNTFTVGKVEITLDEAPVNDMGEVQSGSRTNANEYKLMPGHTYVKDPIVHFQPKSEASWLFVKVEDGLAAIEDATTVADQITSKGWTKLDGVANVYYKQVDANTGTTAVDYPVFDNFKLKTDAAVADYANAQIVITAYAIQQDGLTTATAAWAALSA